MYNMSKDGIKPNTERLNLSHNRTPKRNWNLFSQRYNIQQILRKTLQKWHFFNFRGSFQDYSTRNRKASFKISTKLVFSGRSEHKQESCLGFEHMRDRTNINSAFQTHQTPLVWICKCVWKTWSGDCFCDKLCHGSKSKHNIFSMFILVLLLHNLKLRMRNKEAVNARLLNWVTIRHF